VTHVWFTQADGLPQLPVAVQVSTLLPEHCAWPGAHTPVHEPETHA
jgi:hypothetical protein